MRIYTEWFCGFCFSWLAVFSGVRIIKILVYPHPFVELNIVFTPWGKSVFAKSKFFFFGKLKINWKWEINLLI